jgi:NADH:ubiquinone oxidoreductase subunit 4 (subunit M)
MKSNVGGLDRVVRIGAGLALIALAATGVVGAWGYIGVVPVLTGTFKFCPAYSLFGINTCPAHGK